MKKHREVDVCLTPLSVDLFDVSNKLVVVIDVFRATSAICTALNSGMKEVITVAAIDEAQKFCNTDKYIVAAERNGKIASGFDLGNSPFEYLDNKELVDKSLVITTTNGTKAVNSIKHADIVLLASFLNVNAVLQYILKHKNDIVIVCSGWKGRVCLEDMLLAGMISSKLTLNNSFFYKQDSVHLVNELYTNHMHNINSYLYKSAYCKRMNLKKDVDYCLQMNIIETVPVLNNGAFIIN